ncbi:MAG TPA: hypothetical protein VGQ36_20325 [Thermoanaerobaculia bacterium]|jgi:hypothetical protein|nr:hypothetical protein [Thermoanaerobaculia bacterium]
MPRALRILLLILSIAAATYAVARIWRDFSQKAAIDFYLVYVNVHVAGRDDVPNIYSADAQSTVGEEFFGRSLDSGSRVFHETASVRRTLDSRGSPFLYASFAWISRDFEKALLHYRVLILAAFLAGIVLLGRYCRLPLWLTIFLFALLVHFFLPFRADFTVANVNAIQLFLLALALTLGERRPMIAGAILAMMLAAKPNVVLVVAILMISRVIARDFRRLGREVVGGAIGGAIAFVVGALWFETPRIWLLWLNSAGSLYQTLLGVEYNNVTPALPLFQQYGTWISYAIAAALMAIACVPLLRGAKPDDSLLISLGLLIYFMSATLVWLHYFVLAILPVFALFRTHGTPASSRPDRRLPGGRQDASGPAGWKPALQSTIIASIALLLMADAPYEMLFGPSTPQLRATLIFIAMLMLFPTCVWLLWRGRGRVPASSVRPA